MSKLHRYYVPGAIVFLSIVTKDRIPYFGSQENIDLFWKILRNVQQIHPYNLLAYVLMPDHFHCLMKTENDQGNFSKPLASIKWNFTMEYKKVNGITGPFNFWQKRFWDHIIRDARDLENHFDYVHWNPVKHHFVDDPGKWEQSTFSYWQKQGYYPEEFSTQEIPPGIAKMDYE
ncbi:MAG: REP-associated tyrosine transposase [Omnitrophica WOR_2 bacterium]